MTKKLLLLSLIALCAVTLWQTQRPVPPQIAAKFEVAGIAHGDRVPFKLRLRNLGTKTVSGLSVVATAGEAVQSFPAPILEPGEDKVMEGELLVGEGEGPLEFSARVLGRHYSYRSPEIVVARPDGVGGSGQLYSQVQQVSSPQQMGIVPAELPPTEMAFGALEPVEPENDVQNLISRVELHHCDASRQTLEVYQQMGNAQAERFLVARDGPERS